MKRLLMTSAAKNSGDSTKIHSVTFIDENDPFKLASRTREPLARLSPNSWVRG